MFHFSLLDGLYPPYNIRLVQLDWSEFTSKPPFDRHTLTPDKSAVKMFAAARFTPGDVRSESTAIDANLLVYDVDTFPPDSNPHEVIAYLRTLLRTRDIQSMLITSYSHHPPDKYAYRLIITLSETLGKGPWKFVWDYVRKNLYIPASKVVCKGMSHAYYVPSTCADHLPYAGIEVFPGNPIDVSNIIVKSDPEFTVPEADVLLPEHDVSHVDIAALRKHLSYRMRTLSKRGYPERANYLKRVLEGEPLTDAPKGRHVAMLQVTNDMVWAWPKEDMDHPFGVYDFLLRATMERTLDYNEKELLKLKNMVSGAYRKRKAYIAQADAEAIKLDTALAAIKERLARG